MYIVFSGIVVFTFIINLIVYPRIKKYTIITMTTHKAEERFRYS